jgi:hypothetical protein
MAGGGMRIIGDTHLYLERNGSSFDIVSPCSGPNRPLSAVRVTGDGWMYFGSFAKDGSIFIDFIALRGLSNFVRWRLSDEGKYIEHAELSAADVAIFGRPPEYSHTSKSSVIVGHAQSFSNDLQIYSFLRYVLGDPAQAQVYLDGFCPKNFAPALMAPTALHAVLLFNHNYARNIPLLERLYSGRFSTLTYVLPNAAPLSPRSMSVPAGSYSYHYMIHGAISRMLDRDEADPEGWYLFLQDDVYLNRSFNVAQMARFFDGLENACAAFYLDLAEVSWKHTDTGPWNKRVLTALENQKALVGGNGFEGYSAFFRKEHLVCGVADIFLIKGSFLALFADILGNYMSQGVFPEVGIPSTLKILASLTEKRVAHCRGEYLWRETRKVVDKDYIQSFDKTDCLFLHPVKSSLLKKIVND